MNIYNMSRGTGKTTKLILESHEKWIPVLTMNRSSAHHIEEKARDMGVSIPKVLAVRDLNNEDMRKPSKVLIDDLDFVTSELLRQLLEIKVESTTIATNKDWEDYYRVIEGNMCSRLEEGKVYSLSEMKRRCGGWIEEEWNGSVWSFNNKFSSTSIALAAEPREGEIHTLENTVANDVKIEITVKLG